MSCILMGLSTQLGLVLGLVLLAMLMAVLQFAYQLFTEDIEVIKLISIGIPVLLLPEHFEYKNATLLTSN